MSTRLRQTYRYRPDSSIGRAGGGDDDDESGALDEQQQEAVITHLRSRSRSSDAFYVRLFTSLPLLCLPAFLFLIVRPTSSPSVRFVSILAITSLCASSLEMYLTPVGDDGRVKAVGVLEVPGLGTVDSDGPLGRAIPILNPVICAILGIASYGIWRRNGSGGDSVPDGFWIFCLLPGVVLIVVWSVKKSMRDIEKGIGELGQLRYGLKGA